MRTDAQKHAEFMRRMYQTGKRHDAKCHRLAITLICYAVAVAAILTLLIS